MLEQENEILRRENTAITTPQYSVPSLAGRSVMPVSHSAAGLT